MHVFRSLSGVFSARDGLMTLRDVFRWARRLARDDGKGLNRNSLQIRLALGDWRLTLAHHGFFLLASRCRNKGDTDAVVVVLEKVLKRKVSFWDWL